MTNRAGPRPAARPIAEPSGTPEYPVREYIGAMARELAQMARWEGDEGLAALLESASDRAAQTAPAIESGPARTGASRRA